jgi:hypothetical protein
MRRLLLLAVCGLVLFSFGCKKEEDPKPPRKPPGGRLKKPTDQPGVPVAPKQAP